MTFFFTCPETLLPKERKKSEYNIRKEKLEDSESEKLNGGKRALQIYMLVLNITSSFIFYIFNLNSEISICLFHYKELKEYGTSSFMTFVTRN